MDLGHSALVVVDVQNDFCPGGRLPVEDGDRVVPVINGISSLFPKVVATQDWHPEGHVSFASSHAGKKPHDTVQVRGRPQVLWPDHCVRGSQGAGLHPGLDDRAFHLILRKGTRMDLDSYSAFFENDGETSTGLEPYLRSLGTATVYLCGLATDYCVFYSAMDALRLGFQVFLVEDAARGVDVPGGSVRTALDRMAGGGVKLASSGALLG